MHLGRSCCRVRPCASSPDSTDSSSSPGRTLELLRCTRDPQARARLMASLDNKWSAAVNDYVPSDVEAFLMKELGTWKQTMMQLAVSNPDLVTYDVETQVKPTIKALKAANIPPEDIWFLLTKRTSILAHPTSLQRWTDFCMVYGLSPHDMHNFLLRFTDELLVNTTLFAAGQVVQFLKALGIKNEFVATRIVALWPQVLGRDVEAQLRPIVTFLMSLGIEVSDIQGIVCAWPELLLCDVEGQLQPWAHYLRTQLGCSTLQVAEVITACPHLLGFSAQAVFQSRLSSLQELGVTQQDVARMCGVTTRWLLSAGGITAQLQLLTEVAGFTPEEVRHLVVAAPGLLAEKEFELQRKWEWLTGVLGCTRDQVLACPQVLALGLMQVLGPRHGFLDKQGKLHQIMRGGPTATATNAPGPAYAAPPPPADAASTTAAVALQLQDALAGQQQVQAQQQQQQQVVELAALCLPADDVEWCAAQQVSPLDYSRYRAHWEEEYTQGLVKNAAKEFQDELKKLGIYEGTE